MLILNGACGWIPNTTINFIANIVGIIKIFVPLLIIIMGSIDFAKAIMSQKEDDIKKSQSSFIQKLIAGAAVFFVMIFISWVFRIIDNADSSLNTGNAIRCVNLMLNGGYQAEDIDTLAPPTVDIGNKNTTSSTKQMTCDECIIDKKDEINKCIMDFSNGDPNANKDMQYNKAYSVCIGEWENYNYEESTSFITASAHYLDCKANTKNFNSDTDCQTEKNNMLNFVEKWDLNFDYKTQVPCMFAESKTEKANCYKYEDFQQSCYTYANNKMETTSFEKVCQETSCPQCY